MFSGKDTANLVRGSTKEKIAAGMQFAIMPQTTMSARSGNYNVGYDRSGLSRDDYDMGARIRSTIKFGTDEQLRTQEQSLERISGQAWYEMIDTSTPKSREERKRYLAQYEQYSSLLKQVQGEIQRREQTAARENKKDSLSLENILGSYVRAGDSSLPLNNTNVAIQEIRRHPDEVKDILDHRDEILAAKQKNAVELAQSSKEHPWLASGASVVAAPFAFGDILKQLVDMNAAGESIPIENLMPGEAKDIMRSGVSENMGNAGRFLYHTGMSTLDSLEAAALGGGVPGAAGFYMFSEAAASTMQDIKKRGGSDDQALIGGAAAGVFEALFESLSIGQLNAMKQMPVDSVKTLLKNLGKSVVTNASEEGATELANILFDKFFMGEISSYTQSVRAHMADGKNESAARSEALREALKQIGTAALGGGLTGAAFSGIGSAFGAAKNNRSGSDYFLRGLSDDDVGTVITDEASGDTFLKGFNDSWSDPVAETQDSVHNGVETKNDPGGFEKYKQSNPDSAFEYYEADNAARVLRENKEIRAKGTVVKPPNNIDIRGVRDHAAERMRERSVTIEQAQSFIDNAKFALKQQNGRVFAFYSQYGFTVVGRDGVLITTGHLDEYGQKLFDEVVKILDSGKR